MTPPRPPFPEHLRRARPRRRRRWLLLLALAPLPLLGVSEWRVSRVELEGAEDFPPAAAANIRSVTGSPVVLLDLAWVREQADRWPAVAGVEATCRLDGTVSVTARHADPVASVRIGTGWHGLDAEGNQTGRIVAPLPPIIEAGDGGTAGLRQALAAARRLEAIGIGPVRAVSPVSASVLVVTVAGGDRHLTAHLGLEGSPAERTLERLWAAGDLPDRGFVDATRDDRLVVGDGGGGA